MSNVQQRGGGSWRVWRGGDGFRDCRAGSEWRRFWSVGGSFFTTHSPRDPWAIWRNGVMTLLPNLPGGNNANVFWINNLGQVSGNAENAIPDSSCSIVTPFQVRRFQPVI